MQCENEMTEGIFDGVDEKSQQFKEEHNVSSLRVSSDSVRVKMQIAEPVT